MNKLFANNFLQQVPSRVAASPEDHILLDKNELPFDLPDESKKKVTERLCDLSWNRYPKSQNADLEAIVANYTQAKPEQLVLGAGSAHLLTNLINYFAINGIELCFAQPSFTLFEFHCLTYGIDYKVWPLTDSLEFDYKNFPEFSKPSALIFASPNNPTGNLVDKQWLADALKKYPDTYFIVDEVYFEFCGKTVADMVDEYANLIVVRSLSKAFGVAGLRIGYLLTQQQNADIMRKLILPFSLNYLSRAFIETTFTQPDLLAVQKEQLADVCSEKKVFVAELQRHAKRLSYELFAGEANFCLLRFATEEACSALFQALDQAKIGVLDLSRFPKLQNCLRFTVGKKSENEQLFKLLDTL